jgi:hypothetical protein
VGLPRFSERGSVVKGRSRRHGLIRIIPSLTITVIFPLTQSGEQRADFLLHNQSPPQTFSRSTTKIPERSNLPDSAEEACVAQGGRMRI